MNGHGFIWACADGDDCDQLFVPIDAVMEVEQKNDDILDAVTAVFSATLWDLHERAFEAHGIPHAKDDPMAVAVCEEKGHLLDPDHDDGQTCVRCAYSPFLGG
jgi:hypothetical protein